MTLAKNNYELIFKLSLAVITDYFNVAHPNMLPTANRIAADLIETRPSWKAADFINLCKFLRQRQDIQELKVYGQITFEKFVSNIAVYEDYRAQEMEAYHAKKKGEHNNSVSERGQGNSMKALMGKEMDSISAKNEALRDKGYRQDYPGVADEKYFDKLNGAA